MNGKKLITILVILVISVAAIIISNNLSNKTLSENERRFFPELTESTVSRVIVIDNSDTVNLKLKGDVWFVSKGKNDPSNSGSIIPSHTDSTVSSDVGVNEYLADSASVQTLLEKIVNMTKDELISTNPEKQAIFEVDSSKGIFVDVYDKSGNSHGQFRIGKSGPNWSSNYVRLIGSNSVYMVGGSIKHSFFTDLKRWRDKSIMKFNKASVSGISVAKKNATPIILEKSDTLWNMAAPEQHLAKTEKVDAIINTLFDLKATDFESDTISDSAAGINDPEYVVVVSLGKSSKKIMVGNKTEAGQYRVKAENSKTIFLVQESVLNNLNINTSDLKAEVPLVTDTTSTKK